MPIFHVIYVCSEVILLYLSFHESSDNFLLSKTRFMAKHSGKINDLYSCLARRLVISLQDNCALHLFEVISSWTSVTSDNSMCTVVYLVKWQNNVALKILWTKLTKFIPEDIMLSRVRLRFLDTDRWFYPGLLKYIVSSSKTFYYHLLRWSQLNDV